MQKLLRRIDLRHPDPETTHELLRREWLLTNGLGGYASGTISGSVTRRHHGLLIAALPAPLGRVVMLNHVAEFILAPNGQRVQMSGDEPCRTGDASPKNHYATEFRLENQIPIWRFDVGGRIIEKRVLLVHGQNTVHVTYELLSGEDSVALEIEPSLHFRRHEHDVNTALHRDYFVTLGRNRYEITNGTHFPPLRMLLDGCEGAFKHEPGTREISYLTEAERGYASSGQLWSPGRFQVKLGSGHRATLVASTETWQIMGALPPQDAQAADAERRRRLITMAHPKAQSGPAAELVLAADQFIITPAGRVEDTARARAAGDEIRTVIAGYHWFTDWGRDTMISLEGLTLTTGRFDEAGWILRTFAHYIRHGLIPNFFPDGENEGLYHTADATLWFFHAVHRYVETTGDRATLQLILPKLIDVAEHHLRGTLFGIRVDPADGLLRQGQEGYQLTWMDAKVEDWVVTPRRGKAVEINALWYNALRHLERWLGEMGQEQQAQRYGAEAEKARTSFNKRFWNARAGHLFDVVDGEGGDDPACRPNQVFAISLDYPILDKQYWERVLKVVQERLLTPAGLRSLSREHKDYKAKYFGDLRARDAAYHQGTVWGWLIGPFIDAWLKVHPNEYDAARKWLERFVAHLDEGCVGSMSEVFDAEAPFTPRGCIAQAWSVAEGLRSWVKVACGEQESQPVRHEQSRRQRREQFADPQSA